MSGEEGGKIDGEGGDSHSHKERTTPSTTNNTGKEPPVVSLVELHEETDDSEYDEDEEDPEDDDSLPDDTPDHESPSVQVQRGVPLLAYRRPHGSLFRTPAPPQSSSSSPSSLPLASECTASALGSVWINASTTLPDGSTDVSNASATPAAPSSSSSLTEAAAAATTIPALTRNRFNTKVDVLAYGYNTGSILVVDAASSISLGNLPPIRSDHTKHDIVALSWDATGTNLGVLDRGGMVAIFADLKYAVRLLSVPPPTFGGASNNPLPPDTTGSPAPASLTSPSPQSTAVARPNAFSSFLSAFTGGRSGPTPPPATGPAPASTPNLPLSSAAHTAAEATVSNNGATTAATVPRPTRVPTLTFALPSSQQQVHRISYPKSFGRPTCLALDPSYTKRQHVLVGFADGRLVYTKRGFFQRRQDSVIYQAPGSELHAVAWRGSLVAWADDTGIRLWDPDTQTRIAHIDRPSGARPSLYPTLSGVVPSLCWEASATLLVGWGDCLMQLRVNVFPTGSPRSQSGDNGNPASLTSSHETNENENDATDESASPPPPPPGGAPERTDSVSTPPTQQRRRVVECTMAWQLDGIACGVVPFDRDHVAVLVLVPPLADDELEVEAEEQPFPCDVELQVVSRVNGEVIHADLLPLIRRTPVASAIESRSSSSPRHQQHATPVDARKEVAASFRLLSSFATPRMDDASEAQAMGGAMGEPGDLPTPVSLFSSAQDTRRSFQDPHLRWDLRMISYDENDSSPDTNALNILGARDNDSDSVDSDDYGRLFHAPILTEPLQDNLAIPPVMVVVTCSDVVTVRVSNVDDAVSYALADGKAGLALFRGLCHRRQLREYSLNDLVNAWFRAILRLPPVASGDDGDSLKAQTERKAGYHLSLRRMKLAAEAMPLLLGGDVTMWCHWIAQMERIPGALFIARYSLPVRDPVLPATVYANVLRSMLQQIEEMLSHSTTNASTIDRLSLEAEGHFLNTLVAWGPVQSLKEYIRLYQGQCDRDPAFAGAVRTLEENLVRRHEQSAACYLQFPDGNNDAASHPQTSEPSPTVAPFEASLYNIRQVLDFVLKLAPIGSSPLARRDPTNLHGRVTFDAAAKLSTMQGKYNEGLLYYLLIGTHDSATPWSDIEDEALQSINQAAMYERKRNVGRKNPYAYIVSLIEMHNLHQCLLNEHFLSPYDEAPPILALARLVGLEHLGEFLIRHCIAPQRSQDPSVSGQVVSGESTPQVEQWRGTLPLDLVAQQLEGSPKLLHWYLHLVFVQMPSVYVVFPHTANLPSVIALLHRKHLDLYLKFAGSQRDSSEVFQGVEAYRVPETETRLLSFLKAVLQLGALPPMDVAKLLQIERRGSAGVSRVFALELAYILERFGDESEEEARLILNLYLRGCSSLMLAVSYAQRTAAHSAVLWDALIEFCLSEATGVVDSTPALAGGVPAASGRIVKAKPNGSLFGSLLEAAALSGADLAHLVRTIPAGMPVEGLRPRLVAAVADSRLKVQMRQTALAVAARELSELQREAEHRVRRGTRCGGSSGVAVLPPVLADARIDGDAGVVAENEWTASLQSAPSTEWQGPRTRPRLDRVRLPLSIPIR